MARRRWRRERAEEGAEVVAGEGADRGPESAAAAAAAGEVPMEEEDEGEEVGGTKGLGPKPPQPRLIWG